jgi:hypothetical protein
VLGDWTTRVEQLAAEFSVATPFPLVVIDGFVETDVAESLLAEFPPLERMQRSADYIFGKKGVSSELGDAGPTCRQLEQCLLSSEFAALLKELTGRTLFIDPSFYGGGFHQGGDGSFLDTHVDFNVHPENPSWLRVLNVLLYLNKDWPSEFGGDLLVRRNPDDLPRAIAPLFNRGVIMLTSDDTYHGYRRMTLPSGRTRKSIAAYAYELIPDGSLQARTTSWAPEGANPLKRWLGRHWSSLAAARSRLGPRR